MHDPVSKSCHIQVEIRAIPPKMLNIESFIPTGWSNDVSAPNSQVSTGKLRPGKKNARIHSKKQIEQIVASIRRFGWTYPILIDELGNILCEVGRWLAAQKMGLTKVPVIALKHLGETEKRALILADNKIAANSAWERKLLAAELGDNANHVYSIAL